MTVFRCRRCLAADVALADHRLATEPHVAWPREITYLVGDLRSINCRRPVIRRAVRDLAAKHDLPMQEVDLLLERLLAPRRRGGE